MIKAVIIGLLMSSSLLPAVARAETFGPYFYRTGDEQSYCRWETTIHFNGAKLVVNQCVEQMRFLISQSERQCWTENYGAGEFSNTDGVIQYLSGDIERVDRRSRRFSIEDRLDHHDVVRDVTERFDRWESTKASWLNR